MGLVVLNVAYALAAVGEAGVGGAEQVLASLDRGLVRAGHRSIVVAREDSRVCGELVATPKIAGLFDDLARRRAALAHRLAIERVLREVPVDILHLHGLDFASYLPSFGPPALVTLHLPVAWYAPAALRPARPDVYLHCVSAAQRAACPESVSLLPEIENGVALDALRPARRRCDFVLALGRICPEKGFHCAIEAAERAGTPLVLAGEVQPYASHQAYFREELAPRLGDRTRFVGPIGQARKRRLLAAARCLLVPSLVDETSSLVVMEALACGTPVVAFGRGALPQIVEHGRTGFIVGDVSEMAEAIALAKQLDPADCRRAAEERFGEARMIARYIARYEQLVARERTECAEVS